MRAQSYLNTAVKIIGLYDGLLPLTHYLKNYFSANKKHGSNDRKLIADACYNFYRAGASLRNIETDKKVKAAVFLCSDSLIKWNDLYDENWLKNRNSLSARINFLKVEYQFKTEEIFPFTHELSEHINHDQFTESFLKQPDVFVRIRPHQYETVTGKLQHYNIAFNTIAEDCISVQPSTKLNELIKLDEEAIIQDVSSQKIKEFLLKFYDELNDRKSTLNIWDCCAGSGGKCLLAYDVLPDVLLTVTDVRTSIIHNLEQRFKKAGIKNYNAFVADVSNKNIKLSNNFDLIICDAPCTGSGTWSRTPEQLFFFKEDKIDVYSEMQKRITSNAIKHLKTGGCFLYITCSVFKKENEDVVDHLLKNNNLKLIKQEMITGYNSKADTMFAALFKLT